MTQPVTRPATQIVLEPTTELTLAVIGWKYCTIADLPAAAARLMQAGQAYLAAAKEGAVPKRPYTEQLAWAAQNCSCTRPHERDQAIEPLSEIEGLARDELRAEAEAEKRAARTAPVSAQPLDPERYDVKQGLLG